MIFPIKGTDALKTQNPFRMPFFAVIAVLLSASAFAQLNIPSDGSDGVLNITSNTIIDLSQAVTGEWNANNTANAGKGIYDPNRWAVVFKYQTINYAVGESPGYEVTFKNHPSRAPVIWLVQSNVAINGTINLRSRPGTTSIPERYTPTEPGPGGFRGGVNGVTSQLADLSAGYGIGSSVYYIGYRSYYGNPQILPLIGGSGYRGGIAAARSGSSGAGAILIAAGGTVTFNVANSNPPLGKIDASGLDYLGNPGGPTGGAVKIIADQILGNGTINCESEGRTRIEANFVSPQLNIFPNTVGVPPGTNPIIWPPNNAPTVRVVSVNGQPTPLDPRAEVTTSSDLTIQTNGVITYILETKNFPIQGVVRLRLARKMGDNTEYWYAANHVSGNFNQSTWSVSTNPPPGFFVLQARATVP